MSGSPSGPPGDPAGVGGILAVEPLESRLAMAGSYEIASIGDLGADFTGPA